MPTEDSLEISKRLWKQKEKQSSALSKYYRYGIGIFILS